jgi:hypothetical protein
VGKKQFPPWLAGFQPGRGTLLATLHAMNIKQNPSASPTLKYKVSQSFFTLNSPQTLTNSSPLYPPPFTMATPKTKQKRAVVFGFLSSRDLAFFYHIANKPRRDSVPLSHATCQNPKSLDSTYQVREVFIIQISKSVPLRTTLSLS